MTEASVPSAPEPAAPQLDASGVDREQIRRFLRRSLEERLAWLDDYTASLRELRRLNPQLHRQLPRP